MVSELKPTMNKSSCRSKPRNGDVKRKTRVTHVAEGGREGRGQSKVKATSTGCDPHPVAADKGQVPAGARPSGLSNIARNTHPSPTGLAGSEGSMRRAVRASGCGLCGDCKYVSPQRKTLGKQRQKSSSPGPEQPTFECKIKEENKVPEASQKIITWIGRYPKVTLCDIAQNCDSFSQDCGYVLPDFLKTKVLHCFKQEMRAGFRFEPGCFGDNKHKSEDGILAKNREICHEVQCERSICQTQSLTENQRHLKEHTDVQPLSSHTTCRLTKNQTCDGSAACSASFLLGKRAKKGVCTTEMLNRDVGEDPGPRSQLTEAEIPTDKRIKLWHSVKDRTVQSTPDLDCNTCKNPAKTDSSDKEETCFWISDQSCAGHAARSSSIFGSGLKENGVHKNVCGEMVSHTHTGAGQMLSEQFCQGNEVVTDEPEFFSCQRVRVYFRKYRSSCARTYMSWPFSNSDRTPTAASVAPDCPPEPIDQLLNSDSPINLNKPGTPSDKLLIAPKSPFSETTQQVSHQNDGKQDEDGKSILSGVNGRRQGNMSSYSPDSTNMELAPLSKVAKEPLAHPPSDRASLSSPSQLGRELGSDTASASSLPVNGPGTDGSMSTPSPSAIGLSDWESATTLFSMPSPSSFLPRKVRSVDLADASSPDCTVTSIDKPLLYYEETQMTSCTSSSAPSHSSDYFHSCDSSLLFPQDKTGSDEEIHRSSWPPKLEPYYNTSPINCDRTKDSRICVETEFELPPMLSPVASPHGGSWTSLPPQGQGYSNEEEEQISKGTFKHTISPRCHVMQIVNRNNKPPKDDLEHGIKESGVESSPGSHEDLDDGNVEEIREGTDCEDCVEQGNKKSELFVSDPKIQTTLTTGFLMEPHSSPSSDEDDGEAEGLSPSEIVCSERDRKKAEAAGDTQQGILDEFTAYEQDILLVDVIQDDPELFENLPQESLLKVGPVRITEAPKTRPIGAVKKVLPRLTPLNTDYHCDSPDITEEGHERPWRPQCTSTYDKTQSSTWSTTENLTEHTGQPDANNNRINKGLERNQPVKAVNSLHNHIPLLMTVKNGPWITNPANISDFRHQKSKAYCRQYFSESLSCGFKMCRFQHVPVEGDEKFCIDTVTRFTKNPMCLQKAGAVFTGYYHSNPPGVYFSMPVLLSLLWALLKAGMVSDVFSVLRVSLAYRMVPGHEFLLALFNLVREKGLMGLVPELMQLTFKMASAGLSLDCLDCVKITPEVQQSGCPNSVTGRWSPSAPFPEYLNLAHAVVEIELCTKQEDWRRLGEVFRAICQSSQRPNQMEQISGRIAIALLSESKDKLSLPFAAFAETVCQNEGEDSLVRSILGRIGLSLMLRYHKTHQWAKGRRVVEVLSISKVSYSTLKGLFGNEDRASRCFLVTVATELFLLSGSVEGALNTLRENNWFLSSSSWPCETADLESRTRVLMRLAEKTSHRNALEVLCNLPGLKEPNDLVNISSYCPLFNAHLQVCVDRQTLPVASDTVDFMLSKNLAVDHAVLQILLHKLAKQNLWLRAREVFRHSLSVGYYPGVSAPPGFMALIVPCQLGEVELALAFEMFLTANATVILHLSETTTCCLSITLKRSQSCESEYLSAGSRLLSAACVTQPKLIIHYKAVNSSKEQVFTLDISSARSWLRHNHLWANEVWAH